MLKCHLYRKIRTVQQSEVISTGPRNPRPTPSSSQTTPILTSQIDKSFVKLPTINLRTKKAIKRPVPLCIKDAHVTMYPEDTTSVENRIKTVKDTQTGLIPTCNLLKMCDWLKADKLITQIHGSQRNFGPSCGMKIKS